MPQLLFLAWEVVCAQRLAFSIDLVLEECLSLKQRAEHAKFKRSKVRKVNYVFLPEGIQIEDPPAMPIAY